jgi:hypothetical protein
MAAGVLVPGTFIALTPSTVGAQGSDPLGPTTTQIEEAVAVLARAVSAPCIDYYEAVIDGLLGYPTYFPPPYGCIVP